MIELKLIKQKNNTCLLLVLSALCLLLASCGGDNRTSEDSSAATGALSFNVVYLSDDANRINSKAAEIDCAGQGIATVEAKVYDHDNVFLKGGGPWDCDDGQGTINSVPAGSGRTIVILGKDTDGNIVFCGQKSGIDVVADSENNAGTIECHTFVPNLQTPADGTIVEAGAMVLQWDDVAGASEYRVVIWENNNLNNPYINEKTSAASYTPNGLSYEKTYYWQVFAVDLDGNTGIGSAIWSFTAPANTSPVVQINTPAKGSTYLVDEKIEFAGSAIDSEDGDLSGESLIWTSDEYGKIGTGETFSTPPFGAGTHKITLTAIDTEEATGTDSVVITVATGRLPDTGQEQIEGYEPEPGEDMTYTINPPSYTKLDLQGNELDDNADEYAIIRDNVTGLIWEFKTDDGSIHDRDNRYTWEKVDGEPYVQDDFIAVLNSGDGFGRYKDWRLPTIKELATIVHRGQILPAINMDYFPNTQIRTYWSATADANYTDYAWNVDFYNSYDYGSSKSNNYYVRAVRGGQSTGDLVDNDGDTVTATASGLMWQKFEVVDDEGKVRQMTWKEALKYCETLELAGYDDWRLPNINELRSIVDYEKTVSANDPAINTDYFPNAQPAAYWTATTYANNSDKAWYVDFSGICNNNSKSNSYYVRAVRGGQ